MRKYRVNAATDVRVEFGIDLAEGLRSFPEIEKHAAEMDNATDALDEIAEKRRELRRPLIRARARLRFQQYKTDMLLREAGSDAQVADGGRRGPIFNEVFPDGVSPEVDPRGAQQLPATQKVYDRLSNSTHPNIGPFKEKWKGRLEERITKLKEAVDQYNTLKQQDNALFSQERGLRDAHALLVDKIAGFVRAAFPNDRDRQDAVFPVTPPPAAKNNS